MCVESVNFFAQLLANVDVLSIIKNSFTLATKLTFVTISIDYCIIM